MATCPTCHGKGVVKCKSCKGTGRIYGITDSKQCQNCEGSGDAKCSNCDGKGHI